MNSSLKMKTALLTVFSGIAALVCTSQANATVIVSLEPSSQTVNVGDPVSMDLLISGLGNLSFPSLGAFDVDLSYNPAVLSAVSVGFGSFLNLGIFGSLQFSDLSTPGLVRMNEVSFESPSDLSSTQPDSFTLATLNFSGVGSGLSPVEFPFVSLSVENGQSLAFLTSGGQIEVSGSTVVPDLGATPLLWGLGLAGLWVFRRLLPVKRIGPLAS